LEGKGREGRERGREGRERGRGFSLPYLLGGLDATALVCTVQAYKKRGIC